MRRRPGGIRPVSPPAPSFSLRLGHGRRTSRRPTRGRRSSRRSARPWGSRLTTPALGLSYYRLRISEMQPLASNGAGASVRQEEGATGIGLRTFAFNQFGATVGQSLGGNVVLASTLKLIRAGRRWRSVRFRERSRSARTRAEISTCRWRPQTDLDLGAMVTFRGRCASGSASSTCASPSSARARRRIDAGTAGARGRGASMGGGTMATLTTAADVDLTTLDTVLGDVRHIGAGAEAWFCREAGRAARRLQREHRRRGRHRVEHRRQRRRRAGSSSTAS